MLLQLKSLFMGEKDSLPIDGSLDFSGVEWNGGFPFAAPVKVTGSVTGSAGAVTLKATVDYRYDGICDRCAVPVQQQRSLTIEHILVVSLNQEDNDSFVLIENYQLPLDDLVLEDLLLNQPSKLLCQDDCRGLCMSCGKNLNDGLCGCRQDSGDPRMAVLKQLLDTQD